MIGGHGGRPGQWTVATRRRCVPVAGAALLSRPADAVGRRAAGGRHRAHADDQPGRCCCSTRSRSALRPSSCATCTPRCPGHQGRRHDGRHRRAGHHARARRRRPRLLPARGSGLAAAAAGDARPATPSPTAYFGVLTRELGQRRRPGHARRRAVRAVRHRAVAGLRRDAVRQPRPRRPRHPRRLPRASRGSARSAATTGCRWSPSWR